MAVAHGLSCPVAREIFPEQGPNSCTLHWQGGFLATGPPGKSEVLHFSVNFKRIPGATKCTLYFALGSLCLGCTHLHKVDHFPSRAISKSRSIIVWGEMGGAGPWLKFSTYFSLSLPQSPSSPIPGSISLRIYCTLEIKQLANQKCLLTTIFLNNTCIKKMITIMKENMSEDGLG